jgi:hypothetical protein
VPTVTATADDRADNVVPIRPATADLAAAATAALAAFTAHLDRCALAANTVTAYRRQALVYRDWLLARATEHADAFADLVGAEASVTAWRRHLLGGGASPATVNQALAAITQLYEHGPGLRLAVKRARVPKPGAPEALTRAQENAVRRAADRRRPARHPHPHPHPHPHRGMPAPDRRRHSHHGAKRHRPPARQGR